MLASAACLPCRDSHCTEQGPAVKRRMPLLSACPAVTFEGTAGAQNLAGYAEQVELKFEFGSARRSEYAVVVRRPRLGGSDVQGEVQVLQQQRSFQEQSSFTEELRGASTTLST